MCWWLVLKAQISGQQGSTFPPPLSLPGRRTAVTARSDLCLLIDTWWLPDSHLVTGDSRQLCHLCCWPSNDNSFLSFSFQLYLWTSEVNAVGGCGWLLGTLLLFDLDPNESLFQRVSERRARRQTRYWNFYLCHRVSQFLFKIIFTVLYCDVSSALQGFKKITKFFFLPFYQYEWIQMNSDVLGIYLLLPGIIVHVCREATNFPTFSTLSGSFAFETLTHYWLLHCSLINRDVFFYSLCDTGLEFVWHSNSTLIMCLCVILLS